MENLLLKQVEYKIEKTRRGTWRRHLSPGGAYFAEYTSNATMFGLPLVHYTRGICPDTGRRIVARGIIAVGRLAFGVVAIGHASAGVIAIGQLGVGLAFGLGQASTGMYAVGQLALAYAWGLGQFATGTVAIAQIGFGEYVLAQIGYGEHVWSQERADPEAVNFFRQLAQRLTAWWH
jgi:hypothetical protein